MHIDEQLLSEASTFVDSRMLSPEEINFCITQPSAAILKARVDVKYYPKNYPKKLGWELPSCPVGCALWTPLMCFPENSCPCVPSHLLFL